MSNNIQIVTVNPCSLPLEGHLKRSSPRLAQLQPKGYDELFDATTLAFDVFMSDDKLVFSGPPAFGLESYYDAKNIVIDHQPCDIANLKVQRLDRVQRNWILNSKHILKFQWSFDDLQFDIDVSPHFHDFFKNKNVLFTLSKNNKFEWIAEWIQFYKKIHQIDAVLFYDNQSDNYTLEDLKKYLLEKGLEVDIVLVPWNFKYGPQGGISTGIKKAPWDSDFCQYGMMEHAKERFLKYAKGVINVDIDELIVPKNGRSIFEELITSPAIHISGRWIESIPLDDQLPVTFNNFFYYDKKNYKSDYKWCVNPQKVNYEAQWKVHTIKTKALKLSRNAYYVHYKAINYNWKVKRTAFIQYDPAKHRFDSVLNDNINQVFDVNVNLRKLEKLSLLEKIKDSLRWK